jgi:hypothetical protein
LKNINNWKSNKRKSDYQKGLKHINSKGKLVEAKRLRETCNEKCFFKCNSRITSVERENLLSDFYKLDNFGKRNFINRSVEKSLTSNYQNLNCRKIYNFSYNFLLGNQKVCVCKKFFLATLDISQKFVYIALKNRELVTGIPVPSKAGKHRKKFISDQSRNFVMNHIITFPTFESHYRRTETSRKYLESTLSVPKMYDMYVEKCSEFQESPVKISFYRQIFNTEFNISFNKPKNDLCDTCEKFKISNDIENIDYQNHLKLRDLIKADRKLDRENIAKLVVCFDLEKVITCLQSFVNNFYYKRKINCYNLTAHDSIKKQGYCAVWDEKTCGRSGNDIASALLTILEKIIDNHSNIDSFTL